MTVDFENRAAALDAAALNRTAIAQSAADQKLSAEDAYTVQDALVARRIARGEKEKGVKLGFTSKAKMAQMNVHDVIWGRITDAMMIDDGGETAHASYIHPRVEPEIAFLLKAPLEGRVSLAEAMAVVDGVAPAIEVIDSRYEDFQFDLGDVIADNTSASGFCVGPWRRPDLDFGNLGVLMSLNGEPAQIGSTAGILGHPARALVTAARLAAELGRPLAPGDIVMAGAATAAAPLSPNVRVCAEIQGLGAASFRTLGAKSESAQ